MAEMLPSVSCLLSPRNGDAPLSLETSSGSATLSYVTFHSKVVKQRNSQDVRDDPDAPVENRENKHRVNDCGVDGGGNQRSLKWASPHVGLQSQWLVVDYLWS